MLQRRREGPELSCGRRYMRPRRIFCCPGGFHFTPRYVGRPMSIKLPRYRHTSPTVQPQTTNILRRVPRLQPLCVTASMGSEHQEQQTTKVISQMNDINYQCQFEASKILPLAITIAFDIRKLDGLYILKLADVSIKHSTFFKQQQGCRVTVNSTIYVNNLNYYPGNNILPFP